MKLAHERVRGEGLGANTPAPAGSDDCDLDGFHRFTLMFASLISLEYFCISARMKSTNSAGVLLSGSTPRAAKGFFTPGSGRVLGVSGFRPAATARRLPGADNTPHQFTAARARAPPLAPPAAAPAPR